MISAVILAKNEESIIGEAIKTVGFCDEIIVIDNHSDDTTAKKAQSHGATVIKDSAHNFSELRNNAIEKAKGDWVLFIDADERISNTLQNEIKEVVTDNHHVAYFMKRYDVFWDNRIEHGEVAEARKKGFIRLVRKNSGEWQGKVHERFIADGPVGTLHEPLAHYAHDGIASFLHTVNQYSTLRAEELHEHGEGVGALSIIVYPFGKFLYTFVVLGGFLDGAGGFVYSFMMSFHSFLVRSKLYLLNHPRNEQ